MYKLHEIIDDIHIFIPEDSTPIEMIIQMIPPLRTALIYSNYETSKKVVLRNIFILEKGFINKDSKVLIEALRSNAVNPSVADMFRSLFKFKYDKVGQYKVVEFDMIDYLIQSLKSDVTALKLNS